VRCRRILTGTLVAGTAVSTLLTTPALAKHRHAQCRPGYQITQYYPKRIKAVWRTLAQNGGGGVDELTLNIDRAGTVSTKLSASVEAEVGGGFGLFKASVHSQLGFEITRELTTHTGLTYKLQVPPHRQIEVRYGVVTRRVKGWAFGRLLKPGESTVSPLPSCNRLFLGFWHATVALPETGFSKSKPRRI
jgi:hypothetical protein